jgi:hypothetical protein
MDDEYDESYIYLPNGQRVYIEDSKSYSDDIEYRVIPLNRDGDRDPQEDQESLELVKSEKEKIYRK